MKILLADPSPNGSIPIPSMHFPLGIAYIAAIARHHGHDVAVAFGSSYKQTIDLYLKHNAPDLVGIQTFINSGSLCAEIANMVKTHHNNCRVVLGGVNASNNPVEALKDPNIDFVISGEGEWPFAQLINRFSDAISSIPGLYHRDHSGTVIRNPGGQLIENLDDIPEIPYHLFYSRGISSIGHILTHRGCPHHCSHCPLKFRAGVSIRFHSIARTIAEIMHLKSEFNIQNFEFFDENFTMDAEHVSALCEELERLSVRWSCTARISEISEALTQTMIRSGCNSILFGLGSGVPRLQTVLGTNEDLEYSKRLISLMTRAGVRTIAAFSLGIPSETKAEFNKTIQYALSLDVSDIRFEPCVPIPGTLLYNEAKESGRFLIDRWDDYKLPGQLIYLPQKRNETEFRLALWKAKCLARLKRIKSRMRPHPFH